MNDRIIRYGLDQLNYSFLSFKSSVFIKMSPSLLQIKTDPARDLYRNTPSGAVSCSRSSGTFGLLSRAALAWELLPKSQIWTVPQYFTSPSAKFHGEAISRAQRISRAKRLYSSLVSRQLSISFTAPSQARVIVSLRSYRNPKLSASFFDRTLSLKYP